MMKKFLLVMHLLMLSILFSACGSAPAAVVPPVQQNIKEMPETNTTKEKEETPENNVTVKAPIPAISENKKIFLLGDSTVAILIEKKVGWGRRFGQYMKHPQNFYNLSSGGASSRSYKQYDDEGNWEHTKQLIQNSDISEGAYLLVPFGINDIASTLSDAMDDSTKTTMPGRYNSFYNELKVYIDWSKTHGVTPVLLTPLEGLEKYSSDSDMRSLYQRSYGNYAQTVRTLAEDENILMLDLEKKSYDVFNSYTDPQKLLEDFSGGDPQNNYISDGDIERVHFSDHGATLTAGWVRDLACAPGGDEELCAQFK